MKNIGGDGNCLFRSVSDQLYGKIVFTQAQNTITNKSEDFVFSTSKMKKCSSKTTSLKILTNTSRESHKMAFGAMTYKYRLFHKSTADPSKFIQPVPNLSEPSTKITNTTLSLSDWHMLVFATTTQSRRKQKLNKAYLTLHLANTRKSFQQPTRRRGTTTT